MLALQNGTGYRVQFPIRAARRSIRDANFVQLLKASGNPHGSDDGGQRCNGKCGKAVASEISKRSHFCVSGLFGVALKVFTPDTIECALGRRPFRKTRNWQKPGFSAIPVAYLWRHAT